MSASYTTAQGNTKLYTCHIWQKVSGRTQILNPLSEARDQTHNLMVTSRICFPCTITGTSTKNFFFFFFFFLLSIFTVVETKTEGKSLNIYLLIHLKNNQNWEFSCDAGWRSSIVTLSTWVTAIVRARALARKLPRAMGMAKKKTNKKTKKQNPNPQ